MAMMIVLVATITWLVISVAWTNDYYAFSKGARDGAEAGSALLANLASIQSTKAWVMPLEVLGMSTFLLGFGFAFANILQNVRLRGNTMSAVLPEMKARKNNAS
jgi:1,4-dihydroxy-2-naphthoate octaprenyltransferase